MHVGQPEIAALVREGEPLMIDAQKMEHRRMKIMNVEDILHGVVAEFVGGAEGHAAFDAAAELGSTHRKSFSPACWTVSVRLR